MCSVRKGITAQNKKTRKGKYAWTGRSKKAEWIVKGCLVICKKGRRAEERKLLKDFSVLREAEIVKEVEIRKCIFIQLEERKCM